MEMWQWTVLTIHDRPKSTFALLKVLSETLGTNYVELALET